jgi:hypothetical protein
VKFGQWITDWTKKLLNLERDIWKWAAKTSEILKIRDEELEKIGVRKTILEGLELAC